MRTSAILLTPQISKHVSPPLPQKSLMHVQMTRGVKWNRQRFALLGTLANKAAQGRMRAESGTKYGTIIANTDRARPAVVAQKQPMTGPS